MSEDDKRRRSLDTRENKKQDADYESVGRRNSAMNSGNRKGIIIVVLSIIVIVSIAAAGIMTLTGKSKGKPDTNVSSNSNVVVDEDLVVKDNLEKDAIPEVNALITKYRSAFSSGDVNALKEVYNTTEDINEDVLTSTSKIIESYQNTACYTKRGLEENSYFVFIYDELKIKDIDQLAPNMSMVYVKSTPAGSYYIYRGEFDTATQTYKFDDTTQAYIDGLSADEEVVELITDVQKKLKDACDKSPELKAFMDKLKGVTPESVETNEDGTPVETPSTSESETQSQSESETQSETQSTQGSV